MAGSPRPKVIKNRDSVKDGKVTIGKFNPQRPSFSYQADMAHHPKYA
jgi:hypothetical protein